MHFYLILEKSSERKEHFKLNVSEAKSSFQKSQMFGK